MNDDFEKLIARQMPRALPSGWRAEILSAASAGRPASSVEPSASWWRQLIWPSPLAWGCVGGAWVLIIVLNAFTGSAETARAAAAVTPQRLSVTIASRQQLLGELARLNPSSSTRPSIHRDGVPGAAIRPKSRGEIS